MKTGRKNNGTRRVQLKLFPLTVEWDMLYTVPCRKPSSSNSNSHWAEEINKKLGKTKKKKIQRNSTVDQWKTFELRFVYRVGNLFCVHGRFVEVRTRHDVIVLHSPNAKPFIVFSLLCFTVSRTFDKSHHYTRLREATCIQRFDSFERKVIVGLRENHFLCFSVDGNTTNETPVIRVFSTLTMIMRGTYRAKEKNNTLRIKKPKICHRAKS